MDELQKIIVSGGGTGGHIFPAIAIANAIKKKNRSVDILFVGAKGKMEMEKVPKAGFPIEGLWISGFQRKLSIQNLSFPFKLGYSLLKSFFILRKFKPQAAVGVGGYASGPLLQVATWMGIPCLLQEQNSYPGITNRILAKSVKKICVVYDNLGDYLPSEKLILTGNPVRADIVNNRSTREEGIAHFGLNPNARIVFVTGGSLGAKGINEGIAAHLSKFKESGIQLIWQVGKLYLDWAKNIAKDFSETVKVLAFVDRMDLAYSATDLIISRAGGAISEFCIVGKPVILMPSPNVTEDHQTANAMALVNKEAAILVKDYEAKEILFDQIWSLFENKDLAINLSKNIKKLAITNAADRIADEVFNLVKK